MSRGVAGCLLLLAAVIAGGLPQTILAQNSPDLAKDDLAQLIAQLKSDDWDGRKQAARRLGGIPSQAVAAIPALIDVLRDDRPSPVPGYKFVPRVLSPADDAREALEKIIPHAGLSALVLFEDALRDPNKTLRQNAVWLLGHFGDHAIPSLVAVLNNDEEDSQVRRTAAGVGFKPLSRTNPELSLSALSELMKEPSTRTREFTARALRHFGEPAIPILIRTLQDNADAVVAEAAYSLEYMGRDAWDAVPALIDLLDDSRSRWRPVYAEIALKRITGEDLGSMKAAWLHWWQKQ